MVFDDAQGIELVHHVFLDRKLVNNLVLDTRFCYHIVNEEVKIQFPSVRQVTQVACGIDNQFVVIGVNMNAPEVHSFVSSV